MLALRKLAATVAFLGVVIYLSLNPDWWVNEYNPYWPTHFFRGFPFQFYRSSDSGVIYESPPRIDLQALIADVVFAVVHLWIVLKLVELGPRQFWDQTRYIVSRARRWGTSLDDDCEP